MQNFGVTNKEHYGMLWYFWSGQLERCPFKRGQYDDVTFMTPLTVLSVQ